MVSRRHAALVLAATALATSGCGSNSTKAKSNSTTGSSASDHTAASNHATRPTGDSETALTQVALIAKADSICARVNAKISSNPARTEAAIVRLAPGLASYERAAAAELGDLVPPASLATDWARIVQDSRMLADDTAKLGEYIAARNYKAFHAAVASDNALQLHMFAIAKHDGFKACARPG